MSNTVCVCARVCVCRHVRVRTGFAIHVKVEYPHKDKKI